MRHGIKNAKDELYDRAAESWFIDELEKQKHPDYKRIIDLKNTHLNKEKTDIYETGAGKRNKFKDMCE